jgi:hypothetical protein
LIDRTIAGWLAFANKHKAAFACAGSFFAQPP